MRAVRLATLFTAGMVVATSGLAAQASPRDTTRAVVAGANILVDYGRPYKRGREIFGGLVPFDKIWRTGANQATHLVTDKALMFGSVMVPAGTYTLYTVPGPEHWELVINKQTGQWGLTYDQGQDLGRVSMRVGSLPEVVEQFTIGIEPTSSGGLLTMVWDRTKASVPFMVH